VLNVVVLVVVPYIIGVAGVNHSQLFYFTLFYNSLKWGRWKAPDLWVKRVSAAFLSSLLKENIVKLAIFKLGIPCWRVPKTSPAPRKRKSVCELFGPL